MEFVLFYVEERIPPLLNLAAVMCMTVQVTRLSL
jgi:hypothetical protein